MPTILRGTRPTFEWGVRDAQDQLREALQRLRYTAALHGSTTSLRAMIQQVENAIESGGIVLTNAQEVRFDGKNCHTRSGAVQKGAPIIEGY